MGAILKGPLPQKLVGSGWRLREVADEGSPGDRGRGLQLPPRGVSRAQPAVGAAGLAVCRAMT